MSAASDAPGPEGRADTLTLLDLLWEPDEHGAKDQSDEAEIADAACRAAALSLQQQLSRHVAQDSSVDWSDAGLELPAAHAPAREKRSRPPRRASARSGLSSSSSQQEGSGLQVSGPTTTWASGPTPNSVTRGGRDRNTNNLAEGPVLIIASEHERPTDIAWKIIVRTTQLLASPDRQRWLASRLPGASIQRELIRLWFDAYRPVDLESMLQSQASTALRGLSASMRRLMMRQELFSLSIDSLLVDTQWSELTGMAGQALAVLGSEPRRAALNPAPS